MSELMCQEAEYPEILRDLVSKIKYKSWMGILFNRRRQRTRKQRFNASY